MEITHINEINEIEYDYGDPYKRFLRFWDYREDNIEPPPEVIQKTDELINSMKKNFPEYIPPEWIEFAREPLKLYHLFEFDEFGIFNYAKNVGKIKKAVDNIKKKIMRNDLIKKYRGGEQIVKLFLREQLPSYYEDFIRRYCKNRNKANYTQNTFLINYYLDIERKYFNKKTSYKKNHIYLIAGEIMAYTGMIENACFEAESKSKMEHGYLKRAFTWKAAKRIIEPNKIVEQTNYLKVLFQCKHYLPASNSCYLFIKPGIRNKLDGLCRRRSSKKVDPHYLICKSRINNIKVSLKKDIKSFFLSPVNRAYFRQKYINN